MTNTNGAQGVDTGHRFALDRVVRSRIHRLAIACNSLAATARKLNSEGDGIRQSGDCWYGSTVRAALHSAGA